MMRRRPLPLVRSWAIQPSFRVKTAGMLTSKDVVNKFRPAVWILFSVVIVGFVRTATGEGVRSALREADLQPIVEIVNSEIAARNLPGAVVFVGQDGGVVYSRAFWHARVEATGTTNDGRYDL